MSKLITSLFVLSLLGVAACGGERARNDATGGGSGSDGAAGTGGAGGTGGATFDAGSDGSGGAGCVPNEISLYVEADPESPTRYWVPIEYQGEPVALGVDTGSSLTFLYQPPESPDYVPHAGDIVIGCETIPVPGRNIDLGGSIEGRPSVGLLGADFFLSRTVKLDPVAKTLTRFAPGSVLPGTETWSSLPYDDVIGHIIAPVKLDSKPLRLMFDTGSPDIVWLGEPARPGDEEVTTQDASGTLLTFYQGPSVLEMAGEPAREIDVLRAPSWPYFEQTVKALGGNVNGLVGLNVFAYRTLVFQPDQALIRIAPSTP